MAKDQDPAKQDTDATKQGGGGDPVLQASQQNQTQQGSGKGFAKLQEFSDRPRIAPFIVECGDYKSSGQIIVDTPPLKAPQGYRARWDRSKVVGDAPLVSKLPAVIPGIQFRVNPRDMTVMIYDPLLDNPDMREHIENAQNSDEDVTIRPAEGFKCKPWPTVTHTLDVHQLKTFILECARKTARPDDNEQMLERRQFYRVSGEVPTEEIAERMPGHELYDPHSNNPRKPKFKKDAEAYENALERGEELVGTRG